MTAKQDRERDVERARHMSADEWRAFSNREAATAIARWFEGNGRLERPIRTLTMRELETIADRAISRWVVLNSARLQQRPETSSDLGWMLLG
jgi:hypothetical protein